jgi:hypothetical protein
MLWLEDTDKFTNQVTSFTQHTHHVLPVTVQQRGLRQCGTVIRISFVIAFIYGSQRTSAKFRPCEGQGHSNSQQADISA